jgi:uncharacterized protein with HEPN domain
MNEDKIYLEYILSCIDKIELYSREGKEKFFEDSLIQDAVLRRLHTLSESTQRLSPEIQDRISGVDWKNISGFRNILVHGYLGSIDLNLVWNVIENYLPDLKKKVRQDLEESETERDGTN